MNKFTRKATNLMPQQSIHIPAKQASSPRIKISRTKRNTIINFTTQFTVMDDKELEMVIALATAKLERGLTQEEARLSLYRAGICDLDGNFTEPYKHLELLYSKK